MEELENEDLPNSVEFAKESKKKAQLGKPSKYIILQKIFLAILAVLAVGFLELLIILLFTYFF